jgi:hypothetical protein
MGLLSNMRSISSCAAGYGAVRAADPFPPDQRNGTGHRRTWAPPTGNIPGDDHLTPLQLLPYQRSIKQTVVFEPVGLPALYLWQTLSWAMQEFPHGFPLVQ